MTAVDVDALDKLRDQLAAVLDDLDLDIKQRVTGTFAPFLTGGAPNTLAWELVGEALADDPLNALLPVVEAIATKRAAAELDRMARWTVDTGYADAAVLREFRDRAAALREPTS